MLRVAHIGAGRFSRSVHAPALQRLALGPEPKVILSGVADLDESRPARAAALANDFGYDRAFVHWEEMIAAVRPDVIVCTVQAGESAAVLRQLLPLRIPILAEKPPALTVTETRQLTDLAAECGVATYVAFNRRRMPDIEFARQWASRRRRPAAYVHAEMLRRRRLDVRDCVETAIHVFDVLRYLFGEVREMHSHTRRAARGEGTDVLVRLLFEGGAIGDVSVLGEWSSARESYRLEVDGDRLEVTVCPPYSEPSFWTGRRTFERNRLQDESPAPADHLVAAGILPQYESFLKRLTTGQPCDCTLLDAYRSQLVAAAAADGYCGSMSDATHR